MRVAPSWLLAGLATATLAAMELSFTAESPMRLVATPAHGATCEGLCAQQIDHPNPDPLAKYQWGLRRIGAPRAWKCGDTSDVPIAIIDSGIMPHPEVRASIVRQHNVLDGNPDDGDARGKSHGTKVASIIAADWDGQGIMGVLSRAPLMPVRAFALAGEGDRFVCPPPDKPCPDRVDALVRAIAWAVANGARVINLSWGQRGANAAALRNAIAGARDKALFVVAAGSGAVDLDHDAQPFFPAAWSSDLPNVLTVVQTNSKDEPLGPYGEHRAQLAAPGVEICTTNGAEGYTIMSGTSFATAFVSAAAALTWGKDEYKDLTPAQLRALLIDQARLAREKNPPPKNPLAGKCEAEAVLDIGFLGELCSR
jgi:subtilisin family serine protease